MSLIRPLEVISKKWQTVTPERSSVYAANVEAPLRDWAKNTAAAKERRDEGLRKAIADGRIDRGIAATGIEGWRKPTVTKGPARWSEGVSLAEPEYRAGFAPYHDVISRTDPGPRYAKGDPRNWDRSKKLGLAMHARKIAGR